MTDYAVFQSHAMDDAGNAIGNAYVEVRSETTGNLVTIYSGRTGGTLGNPFQADSDGYFRFHAPGDVYKVRVYTGSSGAPTFERIHRYVAVGTAAEYDIDQLMRLVPDGTVGAPGLAFANDNDTGLYRIGANNLGIAVGGAKVVDIAASSIALLTNFTISSAGVIKAGPGTADGNAGAMIHAAVASGGVASLISQADGTSGFNGFHTNNSAVNAGLYAVVGEPSSTTAIFGVANANYAEIVSNGASSNGMLLGTLTNDPLIFGQNNLERMRLQAGLNIGGTTDPGAGKLAVLTSITSPLHIGGSGTTGTQLTLQTTSGNGTTDQFAFVGGNNGATTFGVWNSTGLAIGTQAPDAPLTINKNTGASVAPPSGVMLHMVGADSALNRIVMDSYAQTSVLGATRANGTQAAKTVAVANDNIFVFGANGWNGSSAPASTQISFKAAETFSGTASGGYIAVFTTPLTTTGVVESTRFQPSGGLSVGAAAIVSDPGIGCISAANSIKSLGATAGIGYATGAGGTVTQLTNKSTGVTLNKVCGQITMNNATLNAGAEVGFTVTNSAVASTDTIIVSIGSGATADSYQCQVDAVAAGSFRISLTNVSASNLGEALVLNFAVLKAVAA